MGEFRIFHRGLSNTRWTPSAQEQQIKAVTNRSPAGMIPTTLSSALQTLPQELYDIIYGYTFTPNDRHFTIDEFYRPPKALQVSRRTRELFAPSFYGSGSIFYVDTEEYCSRWMASLQSSHIDLLSEIRIMKPRIEMSRGPRQELALQYVMVHLRFDLARDFTVLTAWPRNTSGTTSISKADSTGSHLLKVPTGASGTVRFLLGHGGGTRCHRWSSSEYCPQCFVLRLSPRLSYLNEDRGLDLLNYKWLSLRRVWRPESALSKTKQ